MNRGESTISSLCVIILFLPPLFVYVNMCLSDDSVIYLQATVQMTLIWTFPTESFTFWFPESRCSIQIGHLSSFVVQMQASGETMNADDCNGRSHASGNDA